MSSSVGSHKKKKKVFFYVYPRTLTNKYFSIKIKAEALQLAKGVRAFIIASEEFSFAWLRKALKFHNIWNKNRVYIPYKNPSAEKEVPLLDVYRF